MARKPIRRSRALHDLFAEIDEHWASQDKADRMLIEELKRVSPRPQRLFAAIARGARWERARDCDQNRLAVHCAALRCEDPRVFEICRSLGANFMAPDALGDLFVHWAIAERNLEAAAWWIRAFGPAPLSGEGLSLAEIALAVGSAQLIRDLVARAPEALPRSDFQTALTRLAPILHSRHALAPDACAMAALSLLESDPDLASASRALSTACDQVCSGAGDRARHFENAAIAAAERATLSSLAAPLPSRAQRSL